MEDGNPQSVNLTYSFPSTMPNYYSEDDLEDIGGINQWDKSLDEPNGAFVRALGEWAKVANITYGPSTNGIGQITLAQGSLKPSDHGFTITNASSFTSLPIVGDIFLNKNKPILDNPVEGNFGFFTILHELGHALGLKHVYGQHPGDPPPS